MWWTGFYDYPPPIVTYLTSAILSPLQGLIRASSVRNMVAASSARPARDKYLFLFCGMGNTQAKTPVLPRSVTVAELLRRTNFEPRDIENVTDFVNQWLEVALKLQHGYWARNRDGVKTCGGVEPGHCTALNDALLRNHFLLAGLAPSSLNAADVNAHGKRSITTRATT